MHGAGTGADDFISGHAAQYSPPSARSRRSFAVSRSIGRVRPREGLFAALFGICEHLDESRACGRVGCQKPVDLKLNLFARYFLE